MLIESLESRRLFSTGPLPAAKIVLPLTPANSAAEAPDVTVPQEAVEAAGEHIADALDDFPLD